MSQKGQDEPYEAINQKSALGGRRSLCADAPKESRNRMARRLRTSDSEIVTDMDGRARCHGAVEARIAG